MDALYLKELHKKVYDERPMKIKYRHPNPIIRRIEYARLKTIERWCRPYKGKRILDIGCEEGFLFSLFAKNSFLVGMDFLKSPLKNARKTSHVLVGDAHNIPLKDKSIDISICSETLEHVKSPENVLREISRVTKKTAIFSVPNEKNTIKIKNKLAKIPGSSIILKNLVKEGTVPEHINFWDKKSFISLLKKRFIVIKTASIPRIPEMKILVKCKIKN